MLHVNVRHPLTCLRQLNRIIQTDPDFDTFVSETFNRLIVSLHIAKDGGKAMLLPRRLTEEERKMLEKYLASTHKNHSAKALGLLMMDNDCSLQEIIIRTQRASRTIYRWLQNFSESGIEFVETKFCNEEHDRRMELCKVRVLDLIHSPPPTVGIHRSGWTLESLSKAYKLMYGDHVPMAAISRILKGEGYSWRHARKALTSNDPKYRKKQSGLSRPLTV